MGRFGTELNHELTNSGDESRLRSGAGAVLMRKRSEGERGNTGGSSDWGRRMIWMVLEDNGGMRPLGGLTMNL